MNETTRPLFTHVRKAAAIVACLAAVTPALHAQTIIDVTNGNDTGAGSLRAAITQANAVNSGTVTIQFTNPGTTVNLSSGQLDLTTAVAVTIAGNGATINPNGSSRALEIDAGNVNLQSTTVENGRVVGGTGAVGVGAGGGGGGGAGLGGGIYVAGGNLTLTSSSIFNNSATGGNGGSNGVGGATFAGGNGGTPNAGTGGVGTGTTGVNGTAGGVAGGGGGGSGSNGGGGTIAAGNGGNGGLGAGGGGGGGSVDTSTTGNGGVDPTGLGGPGTTGFGGQGGFGGGGSGLGGGVFVANGSTLTVQDTSFQFDGVFAGSNGANNGNAGAALGGVILPGGTTTINLTGPQQTISDALAEIPGTPSAIAYTGAGSALVTGNNVYSGGTTITGATIIVGSTNAVFGSGNVSNGGTITTGNGNHTINITGNYAQTGAGTLSLAVNDASTDQLVITGGGTSTLGGTLAINFAGQTTPAAQPLGQVALAPITKTVVTTVNGYTGTFGALDSTNLANGAVAKIEYLGDNVLINIFGAPTTFSTTGLTSNQTAVVNVINTSLNGGVTSPVIIALGGAVTNDPNALGGYLDQLTSLNFARFASSTAFNNASFMTEQMDNYLDGHRDEHGAFLAKGGIDTSSLVVDNPGVDSSMQEMASHLLAWSPTATPGLLSDSPLLRLGTNNTKDVKDMKKVVEQPEDENPVNMFVTGDVVLAQDFSDASAGLAHDNSTTGGVTLGADYAFTPHFLVGATLGFGHTDVTLDTQNSSATVDTYSPGIYASYADNGWYSNAIATYGFTSYTQDRRLSIGTFSADAHSAPSGDQIIGNLDGGYDFHHGAWTFGPTAGLQYTHLDVNGYNEDGGGSADLSVSKDEADSLRSRLGGRVSYAIQDDHVTFTPHLDASWQHEFLDQERGVTDQFNALGVGSFSVRTQQTSRDSALVNLGLDTQVNNMFTVFGDYSVQAGQDNYFGQSVQAGVKVSF